MVKIRISHEKESEEDYFIRLDEDEAKILYRELYSCAEWHGMNKVGTAFWHIAKALEGITHDKQVQRKNHYNN